MPTPSPSFAATLLALCALPALAVPVTVQVRNAAGQPVADAAVAVEVRGRAARTMTARTPASMAAPGYLASPFRVSVASLRFSNTSFPSLSGCTVYPGGTTKRSGAGSERTMLVNR